MKEEEILNAIQVIINASNLPAKDKLKLISNHLKYLELCPV